jgi:hypothetical protein
MTLAMKSWSSTGRCKEGMYAGSGPSWERKTKLHANSRSVITRPQRNEYGFKAGHFNRTHDEAALEDE